MKWLPNNPYETTSSDILDNEGRFFIRLNSPDSTAIPLDEFYRIAIELGYITDEPPLDLDGSIPEGVIIEIEIPDI